MVGGYLPVGLVFTIAPNGSEYPPDMGAKAHISLVVKIGLKLKEEFLCLSF